MAGRVIVTGGSTSDPFRIRLGRKVVSQRMRVNAAASETIENGMNSAEGVTGAFRTCRPSAWG